MSKIWLEPDLCRTCVTMTQLQHNWCERKPEIMNARGKELMLEDAVWLPGSGSLSSGLKIWLAKKEKKIILTLGIVF